MNQYKPELSPSFGAIDTGPTAALTDTPIEIVATPTESLVSPNFALDYPYTSEGYADFKADSFSAVMPSGTEEQIRDALRDTPNLNTGMDTETQRYIENINGSFGTMPSAGGLISTARRPDAIWTQQIKSPVGNLFGAQPKFKKKEGIKYTGEAARNLVRSTMKLGTVFQVPLWHSGFWITIRTASESELIELYRKITQDKITLGRSTYGLLFSNVSAYTNKTLLDFIADNLYETSLNIGANEDIRNYIQLPDLSLMLWGLACATWPNGFQYERACITDIDKCKHIVSEKLNLARLHWTDSSELTQRQIQHMTNRSRGVMDPDSIKRYKEDFIRGKDNKIQLNDSLSFVLKQPTITEHISAGIRWITEIEENYGRALNQEESTRNDYLINHAQASSMRQYSHYVKAIYVDDNEIDGTEEIDNALSDLTARDDTRTLFMEKVAEFLDASVISFIGIPTYKCPACGGNQRHSPEQEKALKEGTMKVACPEMIPLDVAQTFFPLMVQKLLTIQQR